ncbi:MAG: hypothetical protein ACN6P1_25560 [Pseudomonas sp.]|uniref:hypothetical protein n=1 Tax=Pseudomonas sp. TaxID=306 RepID=UPI003D13D69B
MTQANPFDIAPPSAPAATRESPALPHYLVGVALLIGVIGILMTMTTLLFNSPMENLGEWMLRYGVRNWISHLLMAGLCVYWLTQSYLECNGLGDYRQPAGLLVGYGLVYLCLSWLGGYAISYLFMWSYEQLSNGALTSLFWWASELLRFGIEALLPLWLLLYLFRYSAEKVSEPLKMPGQTLAWCFALGVVVIYLQLCALAMQLLSGMLYSYALEGWEGWIVLGHGLINLLVAFFAARGALPEQVLGFNGGRLALACLITMLLWIGTALVCSALMLVLLLFGGAGENVLLILLGLLQLVLLWPFTRLGLRWGYRAQAAV